MTITRQTSNTAAPRAAGTARAGTPRPRLIILAGAVLVVLAGLAFAVAALVWPAAPPAPGAARLLTGTGTGTMTIDLFTGAMTSDITGHLSLLGAETGHDNLTCTQTGADTLRYTGSGTFMAADGDKLFLAIAGTGTFTPTTFQITETDVITGGTGRFAGARGTYTDTISSVVVSNTPSGLIIRFTATTHGQIRY